MEFTCPDCQEKLSTQENLARHRSNRHPSTPIFVLGGVEYFAILKEGKLLCPIEGCGRAYAGRDPLLKHAKRQHDVVAGVDVQPLLKRKAPSDGSDVETSSSTRKTTKTSTRCVSRSFLIEDRLGDCPQEKGKGRETPRAFSDGGGWRKKDIPRAAAGSLSSVTSSSLAGGDDSMAVDIVEVPAAKTTKKQQQNETKRTYVELAPGRNYLEGGSVLDRLGMWYHSGLNILICRQCEVALTSQTALGHVKLNHNQSIKGEEKANFLEFCNLREVLANTQDVPIPKAGGPPVEGIAAPKEGFSCRVDGMCQYSVCDKQTMLKHSREKHGRGLVGNSPMASTLVQTMFKTLSHVYFEVDPTVIAAPDLDLDVRRYLRGAFLTGQADETVAIQDADRDRTPLLRMTNWDKFQPEIRQDPVQRQAVHLLKAKHEAEEQGGIFVELEKAVTTYHEATRSLLNGYSNSFTIRKVLLNGPGFSPEQAKSCFNLLGADNKGYNATYLQMVRAMIRLECGFALNMKFSYTERQRQGLDRLLSALRASVATNTPQDLVKTEVVRAYHQLCWAVVNAPEDKSQRTWGNPVERFLWLKVLKRDGGFLQPKDVTPILAQFKYFCRIVTLFEAVAEADKVDPREEILDRVGRLYAVSLQLGKGTIFNTVWELQQFISNLAFGQVADPQVYVDPDYRWISIGTETLHLQKLREGMQRLIALTKTLYLELSDEPAWPGSVPENTGPILDDLGNVDRGYCFLEESPFRERKDTFFLSLVERKKLGCFMSDGSWTWNLVAIKSFLSTADALWDLFIHALYVGVHLSTRVAQFLQHQIRNADRPRNVMFQGEEGLFLTRYSKTTNMKGKDSCTPAVLSEPLKEILLVLLGSGFREAQALLAGIVYGPNARWLYRTYLCVEKGEKTTPADFYDKVKEKNREMFGCEWGARDFRQGMITLGREFISPNESFACADDILADAADHTTEVEVAHYAVIHGALPRVTNNEMNGHRWLAKKWGSLLGLGPMPPPEPINRARSAKPPGPAFDQEQLSRTLTEIIQTTLTTIGLTPEVIQTLARAAEKQLDSRSSVAPGRELPFHLESQAGPSRPIQLDEPPCDDEPPLPADSDGAWDRSSAIGDPFDPTTWKHYDQPTVLVPNSSPAADDTQHSSQIHLPGQRRKVVAIAPSLSDHSLDSRRRLHRKPAQPEVEIVEPSSDLDWGSDSDGGIDKDLPRFQDVEMDSDDDDKSWLASDTPGSESDDAGRREALACSFREAPGLVIENVQNPEMDNESALRHNIRHAMADLLGKPNAREKSLAQMLAIVLVMRRKQDAMITIRTGGGKSMLWLVPPLLDPEVKMLVVCPFTALLDEQSMRAQAKMRVVDYSRCTVVPPDVQILFVQVEHVSSVRFQTMLLEKGAPKFTCIVVDEHHDQLGCPADRKKAWKALANWAGVSNMPVILLSATAPPTMLKRFLDIYSMSKDRTALIRGTTNRPEIGLHTIRLSLLPKRGLANLVSALQRKLTGEERMLVFFTSCEEADAFSRANQYAVYHSKLYTAGNTKSYNLEKWAAGHVKVMACTSAFASGVDYPSVRFVVICNPAYSFLTTMQMQMVGRAGRDGRESHAFFVTSKGPGSFANPRDALLVWELEQMVYKDTCRVYQAMKTMDGAHLAKKCRELEGQVLCDVCDPNAEMHRFATAAVSESPPPNSVAGLAATERNAGSSSNWTTAGEMLQREKGKERANPQQRSQSTDYGLGVPLPPVFYKAADVVENHEPLAMTTSQPNAFVVTTAAAPSLRQPLASSSSLPNMESYQMRAAAAQSVVQGRLERTRSLDLYMPKLVGKCPYHFVNAQQLVDDDYPGCAFFEQTHTAEAREQYYEFKRAFRFEKFAYCYSCGMPQEKGRNGEGPKCHKIRAYLSKDGCPYGSFIFRVAFCMWLNRSLRQEMAKDLGIPPVSIETDDNFTTWAIAEEPQTGRYHNCMEAFLWFCRRTAKRDTLFFLR